MSEELEGPEVLTAAQPPGSAERRNGDRRQGERRSQDRGRPDRRRGDRRVPVGVGALLALAMATAVPEAQADIYTRRNAQGVMEATNLPGLGGYRLAYRSKGTLIHSPGFRLRPSNNSEFDGHIEAAAQLHGVSAQLVRTIIQVESEFDRLAVSSAGAQGLMQLMPPTARRFGVTNSFDARQNIFGGTRYLRVLLDLFQGDVALAAAGYNAGEGAVTRYRGIPPYRETQGYVRKVQALLSVGPEAATVAQALFITPGGGDPTATSASLPAAPQRASAAKAEKAAPAPPRVYYRWRDDQGVFHVAQSPPSDTAYTTLRSDD